MKYYLTSEHDEKVLTAANQVRLCMHDKQRSCNTRCPAFDYMEKGNQVELHCCKRFIELDKDI